MKKQILLGLLSVALIASAMVFFADREVPGTFKLEEKNWKGEKKLNKAQRAKEAMEWRTSKLVDENGHYTPAYYLNAVKQADMQKLRGSRAGSLNLQWEELGPDNIGGRTRAVLIDNRDPSNRTIYAGGVAGGMWKSLDQGNTWTRLTNWSPWLTVSCIDQGPNGTIYVGTGEGLAQAEYGTTSFSSGNIGNGIYKLDNNDAAVLITPDVFSGNNSLSYSDTWAIVNRIAVNPFNDLELYAATGRGLMHTIDGGTTWNPVVITGIGTGQSSADVKWSRDGIVIMAAVGGDNKVVVSPNSGASWARLSNTNNVGFPSTQGRIEIAIAPSNSSYAYIAVATSRGCTWGVYRTTDAGNPAAVWETIGSKGPLFDPFGPNCQGWYDNVIAVSPADPNKIYLGGIDFFTWSDQSGWKLADAGLGAGNSNQNYVHPDKHSIVISESDPNLMFIGCDGGVYRSYNALSAFPFPTYSVKNRSYNVTQNYSVGAGLYGDVLGGTQDNGTNYINYRGNTRMAAEQVRGGDGTYAEISHLDPRIMFAGIYFGNNTRSGNGGSSFDGFYDIKVDPNGYNEPSRCTFAEGTSAQFISPFWLTETKNAANGLRTVMFSADRNYNAGEEITLESATGKYPFKTTLTAPLAIGDSLEVSDPIRSRFLMHSICGVWLTSDALDLGIIPRWYKLMNGMTGAPVSVSSSTDGDVLYVGTTSGRVYRFPNMNARCDTSSYPSGPTALGLIYTATNQFTNTLVPGGRSVEGISVDPNNANHVVAVTSGFSTTSTAHVFESFNGGATWTALEGGLPNMPVYDVVVHDATTIIIASELGLWSWDGNEWHEENNGIPRVPVYRLMEKSLYDDGCKVLYIGTHGRGMWRSTTLTASGCNTVPGLNVTGIDKNEMELGIANLNVFPNPVNAQAKISLTLDKGSDVTFRIFDMMGVLHKEITVRDAKAGENIYSLEATGLSSGTYVLAATSGTTRTQSRLFTVAR